eukprot:TRINITY_DN3353_c0_g1_i1.p1 TRINITY_DN3353_c0_g1~~TRINITY_DN3353_c0_g1_i1.p1  ORF type:complete len:425 (-),score=113.92 TRINITY_DN3353_c0_g1_i1:84-1358(-)
MEETVQNADGVVIDQQPVQKSVKDLAKNLDLFYGGGPQQQIGPKLSAESRPLPKKIRKISGLACPLMAPPIPQQIPEIPNTSDQEHQQLAQTLQLQQKELVNFVDSADSLMMSSTSDSNVFTMSKASSSVGDIMDARKSFPAQRADECKVSQTMDNLKLLFDDKLSVHSKIKEKLKKTLFRLRGGFTAKLGDDEVLFRRVDGFWGRFNAVLESDYPRQMTYGSILGTVLLVIVEARQTCLDVHEFGKRLGESSKTIMKSEVVVNLLETLKKLESILDETLYFVGHSLASEVSSKAFAAVKNEDLEEYLSQKRQVALPPMVDAPLLLLRDRLDPLDTESLQKLLPGLKRIEATAKSFFNQGYDHGVILLFVGETVGKACWEAALDSTLRKKIYGTLLQVFSSARANAWALIRDQTGLDMSVNHAV